MIFPSQNMPKSESVARRGSLPVEYNSNLVPGLKPQIWPWPWPLNSWGINQSWDFPARHGGSPPTRWMVFLMENPMNNGSFGSTTISGTSISAFITFYQEFLHNSYTKHLQQFAQCFHWVEECWISRTPRFRLKNVSIQPSVGPSWVHFIVCLCSIHHLQETIIQIYQIICIKP